MKSKTFIGLMLVMTLGIAVVGAVRHSPSRPTSSGFMVLAAEEGVPHEKMSDYDIIDVGPTTRETAENWIEDCGNPRASYWIVELHGTSPRSGGRPSFK